MKVLKGFIWKSLQQYSTYFLKLVFQVILARILSPNEFGILAEMLVFITVAEAFANGGFGTALIQKKDADELDFGTSIISSLLVSICLYIIIFVCAPWIAAFYEEAELTGLLRIFGIAIPFFAFNSIQNAFLLKKYETKAMFISSFVSTVLSGVVAVIVAYRGGGAFSLVLQSLLSMVFNVIILQVLARWKPAIVFSKERFCSLFSFSWKIVLSQLLGNLLENIYNLFIGKKYTSEVLGYYNRGNSFPSTIIGQLRTAVSTITLPFFSDNQEDKSLLLQNVKKITHISVLIMFPMAFGLAAIAEPLVKLFLTDKWLPCVFFLRLECIFYGSLPISASVGNGMIAVGRSDLSLKLEGIKFILTIISVLAIGNLSIEALCISRVLISVLIILISVFFSRTVIGYGFKELLDDIWLPFALSAAMGVLCYLSGMLIHNLLLQLLLEFAVGCVSYLGGVMLFMKKDVAEFKSILGKYLHSNT